MIHHRMFRPLVAAAWMLAFSAPAFGALQVVSTDPARHSWVAATTSVSITFDQALQTSSVTGSSVRVFGRQTGPKSGPVTFSNGNRTLTLTPNQPFAAGETVVVTLSHDLRAADTTALRSAGYAYQFDIAAAAAERNFQEIDVMSNRIAGGQTRIYGALQADLDRDGWVDLATVNEVSGDVRVFMNKGDGSGLYDPFLQPPFPIGIESSPNEPADVDNDGKVDVVVSASGSGGVWIARGAGNGTFSGSQSVLTGNQPHGVAVLDVDGDGDTDIAEAIFSDNRMALMLNNGSGTFGAPTYFAPGCDGPWGLGQADMNADGIYDLVVGCFTSDEVAVHLGNGNGTFTTLPAQDAGGGPWQVALGDVDGDGDIDAASGNSFSANGGLNRNDGTGVLGLPTTVPMDGHTPASDLADLDGDGDLDWILSSFGAGEWRIFVNDGAGNFTFDQDIPAPSSPSCAVPVDFDNDGDIDLALSDELADVVVLMQNQSGPSPLCPPSPASCREPVLGAKALLLLKDKSPDKGDQLLWKWVKGPTTPLADYGDPLTADDLALCLYDAGALVTSATADAGGTCGTKPCWTAKPTSIAYKNRDTSSTGTQMVKLKEGLVDGKASIVWKAKGLRVAMPALSILSGPFTVQMHREDGGPCFGATYSAPFLKSDGSTILKDKAD